MRTLAVPEGAGVVIPPRGAIPMPPGQVTSRAVTRPRPAEPWPDQAMDGPGPWAYALVPLAAGAIAALAAGLPGGGGGGGATSSSGPVRTR